MRLRIQHYFTISLLILIPAGLMISCGDSSTNADPDLGSVEVQIVTTGGDDNPPAFRVTVQGNGAKNVDANDTGTFNNLEPGMYSVELSDIADHCTMSSENPQSVEITGSETLSVTFELNCIGILRNKIVFTRFENGAANLYKSDPDGENITQITDFGVGDYWKIAISPDGTKILFVSEGGGFTTSQIWVVNADGENLENLTNDAQRFHEFPSWSPDGSQIAYHSYVQGGEGDIFIMNADGSGKTNVTNTPTGEWWPDWSPNGNTIAFHVFETGIPGYISTIGIDGTGRSVLLQDDEVSFMNPSWSPDGSKIAFRSNLESEISWEICVADADGSNPNCLTDLKDNQVTHRFPAWSPDGSRLVFDSNRDEDLNFYDVFVINADGSGLRNITADNESSSYFPDWSQLEE
ncbi:TolB family protein [Rhodohalobacter sulfatireducens]|uniref:DUF5050 domain-containing protein n=1 Tax=Rhodohalobacter sulfatireducens TaxID=2911366 RepID=A0ABS9KHF9_9BACT|nr:hypothetical protein [Rhodohalobacter sulfatireducens]MCG2590291.1 hypothetical protein [Rhodohalobacter sulfatireducens]